MPRCFAVLGNHDFASTRDPFSHPAKVVDVEPLKVLLNPATGYEVPHMILAAYMVAGFLVASIYAVGMLKGRRDRLHRLGLVIPLTIACIATPVQLFVGDTAAREVADHQPAKLAAMECIQETGTHQDEFMGVPATGRRVTVMSMDTSRVRNGKFSEHWGLVDVPGMMSQMGLQPPT